jgi:uncharacterized membrane protein YeaQ/YmgE (transglycosylase-associated protein family)
MTIFAMEMMLHPGNIVAWIAVGLIVGWLANKVMKVVGGGGYGVVADLALGVIGALAGGVSFRLMGGSEAGFWGSLALALLGACIVLAGVRVLALGRKV